MGRRKCFFFFLRGKVVVSYLLNFLPGEICVPLCEHCVPWASVMRYYLCMLDRRGHRRRIGSSIPCEEAAHFGPQIPAQKNLFTDCSLHYFDSNRRRNYTGAVWWNWINQPRQRHSLPAIDLLCNDLQCRAGCVFVTVIVFYQKKQWNWTFKRL